MVTRAALAALALLTTAALLLALAWREPARMTGSEASISGRAVENGAALYRDYCAGCHGVAGRGIPGLAPALNSSDFFTRRLAEIGYAGSLRSYVESIIAAGRPVSQRQYSAAMPAWGRASGGSLRDDEIRDIASFILNWETAGKDGAGEARTSPAPIQVSSTAAQRGKAVYFGAGGCVGCHGQPGSGGLSGPDLAGIARRAAAQIPGLTAEQVIRQSILAPGAVIAEGCPTDTCPDIMPRDYSTRLRQAELDALVGYLLTLEEGGPAANQKAASPTALAGLPGEGALPTATPVPPLRTPAGNPSQGRALYDQECAPCHGDRGQGKSAASFAAVFASIDPYQYVRATMDQGVPGTTMPAWGAQAGGRLDDEQLDDIAAYVASWANERPFVARQNGKEPGPQASALPAALLLAGLAIGAPAVLLLTQRRTGKSKVHEE